MPIQLNSRIDGHAGTLQTFLSFCLVLFCCESFAIGQQTALTLEECFRQARRSEKLGDYTSAERLYKEAAERFPNQPELVKRVGIVYQTELKFPQSIEAFQRVLRDAPRYPEVNFYLGLSELGLNHFGPAVLAFDKELDASPKYRRARYYEALALQSLNRNADALRQYELLLQNNPHDPAVLYQMIRFLKAAHYPVDQ